VVVVQFETPWGSVKEKPGGAPIGLANSFPKDILNEVLDRLSSMACHLRQKVVFSRLASGPCYVKSADLQQGHMAVRLWTRPVARLTDRPVNGLFPVFAVLTRPGFGPIAGTTDKLEFRWRFFAASFAPNLIWNPMIDL